MTVSSTSSRVVYQGNGSTTAFPFAFKVQQAADLVVIYTDTTGTDFTLSPSQYTASGFGLDAGGTVTYPLTGSPIASGTQLTIQRIVSPTQPTSISNQGAMWPQVIEAALDRLTFIVQQFLDTASRALKVSPTDGDSLNPLPNATQRANSILGFDSSGQPYAATLTGSLVGISNWLATNFLPADSASAARAVLGAAGLVDNNVFTGTNTFPTQSAGDDSTNVATTAYADRAAGEATAAYVIRSYMAGLGLSNDAVTPNTRLDVAAGICADDANAAMLSLSAGVLDCTTTGVNGLDAGSLTSGTWYHVFAIAKAGGTSPAVLASTSIGTPVLPATYTLKRRLGSFKTDGSAHILGFVQDGDYFRWKASVLDVNVTNPGNSGVLRTLASVVIGVPVQAILNLENLQNSNPFQHLVSDPMANDEAPSTTTAPLSSIYPGSGTNGGNVGPVLVRTNGAAQIRSCCTNAGVSDVIRIATLGWIDRRGRDN